MHRPAAALVAVACASIVLVSCEPKHATCSVAVEKGNLESLAQTWYLYTDLLPSPLPSPSSFASSEALLEALTANAVNAQPPKDRGWSFIATAQDVTQRFDAGESVGFGFARVLSGGALLIADVYAGAKPSNASKAGLQRGDEIVAIGDTPASLVTVADLLAQDPTGGKVVDAIGPAQEGLSRTLVLRRAGVADRTVTLVKAIYSLDPVPTTGGAVVLTPPGTPPVGYVNLRTFVNTAADQLRAAFKTFKDAGVNDVIVDLRYNGGGLLAVAGTFGNLMASGKSGSVMYKLAFNPARSLQFDQEVPFAVEPNAIAPARIAFITSGASASASELLVNAFVPYAQVAIVGSTTYGKPVGQGGFGLGADCGRVAYLVAFRTVNSADHGDYFAGLPDAAFTAAGGAFCPAADDLAHAMGDPAEVATAAALTFATTGACPAAPAAKAGTAATAAKWWPRKPASLDADLLPLVD